MTSIDMMYNNWNFLILLIGNKMTQPLWKIIWQFHEILYIHILYDLVFHSYVTAYVHMKTGKQPKCPLTGEWIKHFLVLSTLLSNRKEYTMDKQQHG